MGHLARFLTLLIVVSVHVYADPTRYKGYGCGDHAVSRDVIIIGGGSSGTHAAIRLQQLGHTVALIEKNGRLGGHVNTFTDVRTGQTFDYGVQFYHNNSATNDYFSYLGIRTVDTPLTGGPATSYANFGTDGKILTNLPSSVAWSDPNAVGQALARYIGILEQYPYLDNGFDLPYPVPKDLLLPFGDFLKKYDLEALADVIFSTDQGAGNLLAISTIYHLKYFSRDVAGAFIGVSPLLRTESNNNQAIYDTAQRRLHKDVFLNSHVTRIDRSRQGKVAVTIDTSKGCKQFVGKKLVIAIQPLLVDLKGLGLDLNHQEESIFKQLNNSYYWDMVIQDSGIPQNVRISPIDLAAPLAIPATPITQGFGPNPIGATDLTVSYFTSPYRLSDEEVKEQVLKTLSKVKRANNYHSAKQPKFIEFQNHSPFEVTVSAKAIKAGFYRKMIALQGQRDTFFTGAAWQAQDSSSIWLYNDNVLLPQIEGSLS